MALTYVCSPLSAPTRAEMLANAAKASTYMMKAEQEFGNRAVAPHAYLPFLLDDTAPEERALALEFGQDVYKRQGLQALLVRRILNPSKADSALFEAVIEMFSTQLYKDAGIVVVRLDPDHDLTNWCLGNQFIIHRHHPP